MALKITSRVLSSMAKVLSANYVKSNDGKSTLVTIKIQYSQDAKLALSSNELRSIYVDVSGSMAGSPMRAVNEAMRLISTIQGVDASKQMVYLYNHTLEEKTLEEYNATPYGGDGGTNFSLVFNRIAADIGKYPNRPVTILMLTDGDDASTDEGYSMQCLKATTQSVSTPVRIDVIGFGTGVKKEFLDRVRVLGNREGLFQYAGVSTDLKALIGNVFEFQQNSKDLQIQIDGKTYQTQLLLESEAENVYTAEIIVPWNVAGFKEVLVELDRKNGKKTAVELVQSRSSAVTQLKFFEHVEPRSAQDVNYLLSELNKIGLGGMNQLERVNFYASKEALTLRLSEYRRLFNESDLKGLTETTRMKLQSLKHDGTITKSRILRELEKRRADNMPFFKELDEKMTQFTQALVKKNYDEYELQCTITMEDLTDVMASPTNYFGWGLLVSRQEVSVDSPTTGLILHSVSQTLLSSKGFDEAMIGATTEKGDMAHGGFKVVNRIDYQEPGEGNPEEELKEEKEIAYCTVGSAREKINIIIPKYICIEHAQKVMLMSRVWLGYLFTLDPSGYNKNQPLGFLTLIGNIISRFDGTQKMREDITDLCQLGRLMIAEDRDYNFSYGNVYKKFPTDIQFRQRQYTQNLLTPLTIAYLKGELKQYVRPVHFEYMKRMIRKTYSGNKLRAYEKAREIMYSPEGQEKKNKGVEPYEVTMKKLEGEFASYFVDSEYPQPFIPKKDHKENLKVLSVSSPMVMKDVIMSHMLSMPEFMKVFLTKTHELDQIGGEVMDPAQYISVDDESQFDLCRKELVLDYFYHNGYPDVGVDHNNVLEIANQRFNSDLENETKSFEDSQYVQYIANAIVDSKDIFAFGGMLRTYCSTRSGRIFELVVNGIIERKDTEKLITLMMNRTPESGFTLYTGALDKEVWIPFGIPQLRLIRDLIGKTKLQEIEDYHESTGYTVGHIYRMSNKANRHGFCNGHPNPKLTYQFRSYDKSLG